MSLIHKSNLKANETNQLNVYSVGYALLLSFNLLHNKNVSLMPLIDF